MVTDTVRGNDPSHTAFRIQGEVAGNELECPSKKYVLLVHMFVRCLWICAKIRAPVYPLTYEISNCGPDLAT